jgi:hypothetical protein
MLATLGYTWVRTISRREAWRSANQGTQGAAGVAGRKARRLIAGHGAGRRMRRRCKVHGSTSIAGREARRCTQMRGEVGFRLRRIKLFVGTKLFGCHLQVIDVFLSGFVILICLVCKLRRHSLILYANISVSHKSFIFEPLYLCTLIKHTYIIIRTYMINIHIGI